MRSNASDEESHLMVGRRLKNHVDMKDDHAQVILIGKYMMTIDITYVILNQREDEFFSFSENIRFSSSLQSSLEKMFEGARLWRVIIVKKKL
jgi:hypothetical protein